MYYGSLYTPALAGSRGGPGATNTSGGRGGGRIYIKVSNRFYMDGMLYVDGDDGTDGSGGGSGGAAWIISGQRKFALCLHFRDLKCIANVSMTWCYLT